VTLSAIHLPLSVEFELLTPVDQPRSKKTGGELELVEQRDEQLMVTEETMDGDDEVFDQRVPGDGSVFSLQAPHVRVPREGLVFSLQAPRVMDGRWPRMESCSMLSSTVRTYPFNAHQSWNNQQVCIIL